MATGDVTRGPQQAALPHEGTLTVRATASSYQPAPRPHADILHPYGTSFQADSYKHDGNSQSISDATSQPFQSGNPNSYNNYYHNQSAQAPSYTPSNNLWGVYQSDRAPPPPNLVPIRPPSSLDPAYTSPYRTATPRSEPVLPTLASNPGALLSRDQDPMLSGIHSEPLSSAPPPNPYNPASAHQLPSSTTIYPFPPSFPNSQPADTNPTPDPQQLIHVQDPDSDERPFSNSATQTVEVTSASEARPKKKENTGKTAPQKVQTVSSMQLPLPQPSANLWQTATTSLVMRVPISSLERPTRTYRTKIKTPYQPIRHSRTVILRPRDLSEISLNKPATIFEAKPSPHINVLLNKTDATFPQIFLLQSYSWPSKEAKKLLDAEYVIQPSSAPTFVQPHINSWQIELTGSTRVTKTMLSYGANKLKILNTFHGRSLHRFRAYLPHESRNPLASNPPPELWNLSVTHSATDGTTATEYFDLI